MGNVNQRISGIFLIELARGKILILSSVGEGMGEKAHFNIVLIVTFSESALYWLVKLQLKIKRLCP